MKSSDRAPVLVLIRASLRPGCDLAAYEALDARMTQILKEIPGYEGVEAFTDENGESLAIARFESREALHLWREHPEHREAQRAGREQFYASYEVRVCTVERAYDFSSTRKPPRSPAA
jgi:heme-degrading monooxygenase HmoA